MIDDDGSGTTGTILNNAWKQELYGQIDGLAAAPWVTPAFVASDYFTTTGGASWTVAAGNVLQCVYCVMGRLLFFDLQLNATTIGGAPVQLIRKPFGNIPIGVHSSGGAFPFLVNAPGSFGMWTTGANLNLFQNFVGGAWAAGSFGCRVQGFYEIA